MPEIKVISTIMETDDMPTILSTTYTTSNAVDWNNAKTWAIGSDTEANLRRWNPIIKVNKSQEKKQSEENNMTKKRLVQIFVCDPNPSIPLTESLIVKSTEPKLTDLTDQELYFEMEIPRVLAIHNEKRVKFVDKELSQKLNKEVFLEPAKIRDLKMVVVNIAEF